MADLKTTNIFGDAYINNKVGIATNTPATRLQIGQLSPTAATEGIQFGDDTSARIYRDSAGIIKVAGGFQSTTYVQAGNYLQTNGNLIYPSGQAATQRLQVGNAANNAWMDGITIAPGGHVTTGGYLYAGTYLQSGNSTIYPAGQSNTMNLYVGNAANNAWISGIAIAPGGVVTVAGNISAANLSGTNTGDQTIGNGTITIAAGTGVGVGTTNTFTTNQSGATTVTITNAGVTSAVAGIGVGVSAATGAVTFSIGQAVGTGNSPTFTDLFTTGNIRLRNGDPTITFSDTNATSSFIHVNSSIFHILSGPPNAAFGEWVLPSNGRWPLEINLTNNNATFGGNIDTLGLIVAGGNATIYRDLIVNGGISNPYGNRIIVGGTSTTYTLQDATLRPTVYLNGDYPVLTLNNTANTNANHGPTIQFAFNGLVTGGTTSRQIVIGANGVGSWLDFGFSGGQYGTNTNYNPHNGISGYNGITAMRLFSNGLLIGSTGTYPNAITSISNALDVRGTGYFSSSLTASVFTGAGTGLTGTAASLTAGAANSVAWTNVSGRPTAVSSFINDSLYQYHRGDITSLSSSATNLTQSLGTFDGANITNAPSSGWYNYFSSTHGNYLTSLIANLHRSANWYVGYKEGPGGTPTNPVWYALLHEGNYTTYTVTKTGTGASGTWAITSSHANALNTANNYTVNNLRVTSTVGVGTTSPQGVLEVQGSTDGSLGGLGAQTQLWVSDNRNQTTGVGGGISFAGEYINSSAAQITFGAIRGSKANDTSANTVGNLELYAFGGDFKFHSQYSQVIGVNTELVTIKADGKVGIGRTSPQQKLHIAGTNARLAISNDSDNNWAEIGNDGSSGQNTLEFFAGSSVISAMSITNANNVGIGTTVPIARLHVNSTTAGATLLRTDGTNGTLFSVVDDLSDSLMSVNNAAGLPVFEAFADDRIVMGQYGQNDFVLKNNRVGIGTNNPQFKLDVTGSLGLNAGTFDGNWPFIVVDPSTSGGTNRYVLNKIGAMGFNYADSYAQLQLIGASGAYIDFGNATADDSDARMIYYSNSRLDIQYGTTMTLNSTGVGIGTTVPSSKLEVGNFLDEVTNKITVSAIYIYQPEFNFRLGQSGTNYDWIGGVISCGDDGNYNGVMNFKTCNSGRGTPTTKMVIKASGNVGIGTTVPSTTLHVNGIISGSTFNGAGTGLTGTAANLTAGAATTATNSTQLGGVAAASYVTLNGTQSLTNKTINESLVVLSNSQTITEYAGYVATPNDWPTCTEKARIYTIGTINADAAYNSYIEIEVYGSHRGYDTTSYFEYKRWILLVGDKVSSNLVSCAGTAHYVGLWNGTDATGFNNTTAVGTVLRLVVLPRCGAGQEYVVKVRYANVNLTRGPFTYTNLANNPTVPSIGAQTINISGNAATATTANNVGNGTITISAGTGMSIGSPNTFTTNQSGNTSVVVTNSAPNETHTGEVTGATALTIANDAVTTVKILNANVTLAKIANISTGTILGNNGASAAAPLALTSTQVATMLSGQTMNIVGTATTASYANALNAANQYTVGGITGSHFGTSSWASNATTATTANNVGNGTITISAGTGMSIGSPNTFTTNQSGNTSVVVTNSAPNETHTGEVTGATALTIAANAVTTTKIADANVTLAKIANISTGTILGNNGASAAAPLALTSAQVATMLSGQTMNIVGTATTASYANALNAANQYTVSGITGSLFGTSSWATNAVTSLNGGVTSITAGTGIGTSASTGAVTITNNSPNATHTGDVTGATTLTIANDAVTTAKILNANVTNAKLANSSVTVGSTAISLGAAATTIAGLTSLTSTSFTGSLLGTATTASYANALNSANQYTVGGITGSLFGTSSWATNAVTALNGGVTSISAGTGIGTSASTGAVTITNNSPNATHTGDVTGATALTIANDAVTTVKILNANVTNAKLANSSVTIGSTAVSLGAAATTIAGLTSVTSTTFVGALTGTATTASYANALNSANQYTVGGITGSLFGTSSWATTATNSTQLGGVAAASYVTLTGTQTLTNKTVSGSFTGVMIENRAVQTNISGALTIDVSTANVHVISLTSGANVTSITYNNRTAEPAVNTILLVLKYAGSATVSWTSVVWANGTAPTLTGVNGYADVYALTSYKGTTGSWIGTVVAQNLVSTNL